jgi:hypothetical protein
MCGQYSGLISVGIVEKTTRQHCAGMRVDFCERFNAVAFLGLPLPQRPTCLCSLSLLLTAASQMFLFWCHIQKTRGILDMQPTRGLPQPAVVLPWDVQPRDGSPTKSCQEAPAHPSDLGGARLEPFMNVAL